MHGDRRLKRLRPFSSTGPDEDGGCLFPVPLSARVFPLSLPCTLFEIAFPCALVRLLFPPVSDGVAVKVGTARTATYGRGDH